MNPSSSARHEAYIVKERYIAETFPKSRDAALTCGKTFAIAAAISCGVRLKPDGFERVIDGFEPTKSTVTFAVEDNQDIRFLPEFAAEAIDTATLLKRLQDEKWIEANPHHPIAFMYWALRNYGELVKAIRQHKPLMVFQKHSSKAFVVVGGERAANAFVLEKAGFSGPEIDEILSTLP